MIPMTCQLLLFLWNLCDSDDELTNEQRVEFLSNLVVEHKKLIKNYLKDHDILEARKNQGGHA